LSITDTAQQHSPALLPAAETVRAKFEKAFELFNSCHVIYDSADLLEEVAITELGKLSAKMYY